MCPIPEREAVMVRESVGHFEGGDTLVVDTIGLNDRPSSDG